MYIHVLFCLSFILSFCGPIKSVKLRYHCIPLFYKWTFFICNIKFSAVQFYVMSLLAYYKVKFKAVMVNMLFCFQVRHPRCVEYEIKCNIYIYIYKVKDIYLPHNHPVNSVVYGFKIYCIKYHI
jgi:hypothetical protein